MTHGRALRRPPCHAARRLMRGEKCNLKVGLKSIAVVFVQLVFLLCDKSKLSTQVFGALSVASMIFLTLCVPSCVCVFVSLFDISRLNGALLKCEHFVVMLHKLSVNMKTHAHTQPNTRTKRA